MRVEYFLGERDLPAIVLSAAERATLERAGRILASVREQRAALGWDDDDDTGTDIALAAYVCAEVSTDGRVTA